MLRRRFVRVAAVLPFALAAGCGDLTGSESAVSGYYTLDAVYGGPVPGTLEVSGGLRTDVVDGYLELRSDRTFDLELELEDYDTRTGRRDSYTQSTYGRYSVSGGVLLFTGTTDGALDGESADVRGNTVTLGALTFRR